MSIIVPLCGMCGKRHPRCQAVEIACLEVRVGILVKERDEARAKWANYERDYILPLFKRAERLGFDLSALVMASPGVNCVALFAAQMEARLEAAQDALRELRERGTADDPCFCTYRTGDGEHHSYCVAARAALATTPPAPASGEDEITCSCPLGRKHAVLDGGSQSCCTDATGNPYVEHGSDCPNGKPPVPGQRNEGK